MIYLYNDSASNISLECDMILTDPPFEMSAVEFLANIAKIEHQHLLLICTMRQALDVYKLSDYQFSFDLVIDYKVPTKNVSKQTPNKVHANILYFRKKGVKSAFNRRLIQRHDHYSDKANNHYYPSIFNAPKVDMRYEYQKNQLMINDLVGAFEVDSICDPFAGSGTTALACLEHQKEAYMIECDKSAYQIMKQNLKFFGDVNER